MAFSLAGKPWNFTEEDVNSGKLPTAGTLEFDYVSTNAKFRQASNAYTMPEPTFLLLCLNLREIQRSIPKISYAASEDADSMTPALEMRQDQSLVSEIGKFFKVKSTGLQVLNSFTTFLRASNIRGLASCLLACMTTCLTFSLCDGAAHSGTCHKGSGCISRALCTSCTSD